MPRPLSSFRSDLRTGVASGPVTGLAIWGSGALVLRPESGVARGALVSVLIAPPAATMFGMTRSLTPRYGIAAALLSGRRALPAGPLRFVGNAYRRGVLRRAGMVCEFRPARLADRLRGVDS